MINFKHISFLYHIRLIKLIHQVQAKSLQKYPNQILHLVFYIGGFIPIFLYGDGDFLATWLHDTHSQKENNFTKSHFFSVPMKQSKSSPKCARKRLQSTSSPLKIHHKKLEIKNLSIPLSLSLSLYQLSNFNTTPTPRKKERKKETHKLFQQNKTNPPQVFIFFLPLKSVLSELISLI